MKEQDILFFLVFFLFFTKSLSFTEGDLGHEQTSGLLSVSLMILWHLLLYCPFPFFFNLLHQSFLCGLQTLPLIALWRRGFHLKSWTHHQGAVSRAVRVLRFHQTSRSLHKAMEPRCLCTGADEWWDGSMGLRTGLVSLHLPLSCVCVVIVIVQKTSAYRLIYVCWVNWQKSVI